VVKQEGNNECGNEEQVGTKVVRSHLGLEHCEQGWLELAACVCIRRQGSPVAVFALSFALMRDLAKEDRTK